MSEKLLEQLITTETEYFKWETKLDELQPSLLSKSIVYMPCIICTGSLIWDLTTFEQKKMYAIYSLRVTCFSS